jgi:DNA-binding GntR family transcriptional regulator
MVYDLSPKEPLDRRSPVTPQAHRLLRDAIVSLRLEPGQALSEKEVAVQLGVSRTPVREAFIRLANEGLVDVFPQHATKVARIDLDAVREGQFIREVLEVAAVLSAVPRRDTATIGQLETNLVQQRIASQEHDTDRFHSLDQALHRTIFEMGGHRIAWNVVQVAMTQLDRVRRLSLPEQAALDLAVDEHTRIVRALKSGHEHGAGEAVRIHARTILSIVQELTQLYPQYFAGTRMLHWDMQTVEEAPIAVSTAHA